MSSSTLEEDNIATEQDPLLSIQNRLENRHNAVNGACGSTYRQGNYNIKFNGKYPSIHCIIKLALLSSSGTPP